MTQQTPTGHRTKHGFNDMDGGDISGYGCSRRIAYQLFHQTPRARSRLAKDETGPYREYILALSGIVEERVTAEAQARYSDAVNSLQLVAPASVLHALDTFIEHTSFRNPDKDIDRHDKLLSVLIKEMRKDLQPSYRGGGEDLRFRLLGVPPSDLNPLAASDSIVLPQPQTTPKPSAK